MIKLISSIKEYNKQLTIEQDFLIGSRNGLSESANYVTSYIKSKLNNNSEKTGKLYYRPSIGAFIRASAKGEYPARVTGDLSESIENSISSDSVSIGSTLSELYPKFLEEEADRSYLERGIKDNAQKIEDIISINISNKLCK